MENNYHEEERWYQAKKKVEEIKGFYGHLTTYILVNAGFIVINLLTSPEEIWFYWPILGWGVGLLIHAIRVFNYMPFLGKNWEQRKIKEFMEAENQNKPNWK